MGIEYLHYFPCQRWFPSSNKFHIQFIKFVMLNQYRFTIKSLNIKGSWSQPMQGRISPFWYCCNWNLNNAGIISIVNVKKSFRWNLSMEDETLYEKKIKRPKKTTLSKKDTILAMGGPWKDWQLVMVFVIGKHVAIVTHMMYILRKLDYLLRQCKNISTIINTH